MLENSETIQSDNGGLSIGKRPTTSNQSSDQSDDEEVVRNVKKRTEIFADSNSDSEKYETSVNSIAKGSNTEDIIGSNSDWSSDDQMVQGKHKGRLKKSRIKSLSSSEDSDCESTATEGNNSKNTTTMKQSTRINNKRINMYEKLQSFKRSHRKKKSLKVSAKCPSDPPISSNHSVIAEEQESLKSNHSPDNRDSDTESPQCVSTKFVRSDFDDNSSSSDADEAASIEKIKQVMA